MRRDVVTAAKGDMRGGAEPELRGDDHVRRVELPSAGRGMFVVRDFVTVQHAVLHLPLADGRLPAVNGLFADERCLLVENGGDNQLRRRDNLRGG